MSRARKTGGAVAEIPPHRVIRPWGYFAVLEDGGDGYKIKRFVVHPGKRLSLQRHMRRSEHWYIVRGEAFIVRGDETISCREGASLDIPLGAVHRIQNAGSSDLVVVEVQQGDYLGEDDIERLDDDFGR